MILENSKEREDHKLFCKTELEEKQKLLEHIGLLEQELNKIRQECENYKYENEKLKCEISNYKVFFIS